VPSYVSSVSNTLDKPSHRADAAACPFCGGPAGGPSFPYQTAWNGVVYDYRRCRGCGSTFVAPPPTEEELKSIYAWGNYHAKHYPVVSNAGHARTLKALAGLPASGKRLLDFGCGNGSFLLAARDAGFACRGVEYEDETIRRVGEATGVPVSSLDALAEEGHRFDVVHMNDVLHHLRDPAATLRRLEGHLAPGGVFCIGGPLEDNASPVRWVAGSLKRARRLLGVDRVGTTPPTMLVRTTRDSQRQLFDRRGYAERSFEVYETGWPYYVAGRPWLQSPAVAFKQAVGAAAVVLSGIQPSRFRRWGNRFLGLYQPRPDYA
jgi:SAM-dependent methyltransferase